ncbi:cytochrome P450 [Mycolicibacterium thermoresistibile]|uniref:Steroid C26-monooxygenase n=2 Tax=Mycolicibacterium thermoresistibile TaxID=1797 RepID=G7CN13_MYCT3|nr:cytochrome P450 [Mycolicibacterium thermoresistibile]EHI10502.1 cytochrome P450 [Mycolicibacterium thermoresistibile ATCC 19527]MCV7189641.1 cytochrome P450 [Mycolicibacterium thermoresistibile]GAT15446.1 cytochrome P450 [Mycolicibacterium thermoresistibile]SNW17505.1 cytochrome P450 [Mycolicibacterium thermoresistibile]
MVEPTGVKDPDQSIREAQARFNTGMGADGDASPYPLLRELRAQGAVHAGWPEMGMFGNSGDGPPTFTAYTFDTVKAILTDNVTFSTRCYADVVRPLQGPTILEMQEPEHAVYRRLHEFAFARSSMKRWDAELVGPLVARTIRKFKDAKRIDLVSAVFMPIPVRVIAALLGLPETDVPAFHRLAIDLLGFRADMDRALKASAEMKEYFVEILADKRRTPGDDMVSILAGAEIDGARMSDEQIYGFMRNLLPAGAETTARSTASLALGLLTHPRQLDAVRADRSLLPQAIEEGIRWETPLLNFMRAVTRDTEIGGVQVPQGATMMLNLGSANHDETRWDDPESFDIFRERKPHIGFGHGAHVCLGMHLARLETTKIFNALFDELPNLRLDPDAPEPYVSGLMFRSPPRLDVIWD